MEKLIRDAIPDLPTQVYWPLRYRSVKNLQEHIQLLVKKLSEEKREFHEAKRAQKNEELVDVLEVYDALIGIIEKDIPLREKYIFEREQFIAQYIQDAPKMDRIYQIKEEKRAQKWGFELGIIGIFEKNKK